MKKLLAFALIIVAICYAAICYLPTTLKTVSEKTLTELLQTPVTVNGIDLSILKGTFTVKQVAVKDFPKFSDGNAFTMSNLVLEVEPASLLKEVIVIKKVGVDTLDLSITGGIKENSLKELQHVLSMREQLEAEEKAKHIASTDTHNGHNHEKAELKLKVEQFFIKNMNITAKITKPINLPEKSLNIDGLKIKNIGNDEGLSVHQTVRSLIDILDMTATKKVSEILPAQKVYEEASEMINKGIEKSKQFIDKTFTEENMDKSKEKANDLMNKYLK